MNPSRSSALLRPVDLSDLERGNLGIPFAHRLEGAQAGPEAMVTALVHGNELCGAHALRRFMDSGIRPERGALTVLFCNVDAYRSFDPAYPARARYVDEDFNRIWDPLILDGPRRSAELERARQVRPLIDGAELLLDLHSMQTDCEPIMLSGTQPRAQGFAAKMGFPRIVAADPGHAAGPRMRDYGGFGDRDSDRIALLAECGQHLDPKAADDATEILARFLLAAGLVSPAAAEKLSPLPERDEPRLIEVTDRVTVRQGPFRFEGDPESLDVVPAAGTLIGMDGSREIRTPYDECVLIMPSRRLTSGQTAVRLGRYVD
ncbi:MAG: succinylglutamate desuccinylase/aspartoacylase family protein [Minwuia sp.]|uniref:succinylglutamate desuccinylase/aspartoacylase domain-containing protein n=1 Tax=Minwuia sp. TaxID=2493630 RepID=UPI003A84B37C